MELIGLDSLCARIHVFASGLNSSGRLSTVYPIGDQKVADQKGDEMAQFAADGPNAEQIEYWNEVSGARWVEMGDVIDAQLAPLGEVAMDRARIESGEVGVRMDQSLGDALQYRTHVADVQGCIEVAPQHIKKPVLREITPGHFAHEQEIRFPNIS